MPSSLRRSILWTLLPLLLTAGGAPPAVAQEPPSAPVAAGSPSTLLVLPLLRGLPDTEGTLVVLAPTAPLPVAEPLPERVTSLRTIARSFGKQVVAVGSVSTLAPLTMPVITTRPGAANFYTEAGPGAVVQALLATLTPAQWQIVCSVGGIGAHDLTDDQQPLWDALLPEHMQLQKYHEKGDIPGVIVQSVDGDTPMIDIRDRSAVRLRVNKTVDFHLAAVGSDNTSYNGNPYFLSEGDGYNVWSYSVDPNGGKILGGLFNPAGRPLNSAYGVPLVTYPPARLKDGAIDFAAASLNGSVALTDLSDRAASATPPTVGELLTRISLTTGVEFVADRRVRDLPLYIRGDSARTGDLLKILAWSVSGAFRKVPPATVGTDTTPLYLLTDNVEGIGARVAQLAAWAENAEMQKQRLMNRAPAMTAKNDPLRYLAFAPDDRFALSEALSGQVESLWRKNKNAEPPKVAWSDLSPELQTGIQKFVNAVQNGGKSLRTDALRVGEEMCAYLIFPEAGGVAVKSPDLSTVIHGRYLQEIAADPSVTPPPTPPAPVDPLMKRGMLAPSLSGQRHILIVRAADAEGAITVTREAARHGFTDLWLEVGLSDPAASGRLLQAVTRASSAIPSVSGRPVTIGGVVRLLKNSGVSGEPDRNILGETGAEYADREMPTHADPGEAVVYQQIYGGYRDWVVPDEADLQKRLVALIAAAPDLPELALRAGSTPGWAGVKEGGEGVQPCAGLGYTSTVRRQFLRDQGIDPIDIPDRVPYFDNVRWDIGFFVERNAGDGDNNGDFRSVNGRAMLRSEKDVPRLAWWGYRKRRNDALLAGIFQTLRKRRPELPLYLDNRISSYAHMWTDWFGSWEAADRVPDTGMFLFDAAIRANSRGTSKKIFLHWRRWMGFGENEQDRFETGVRFIALQAVQPLWDGAVIDLAEDIPTADVLHLLQALPARAPSEHR